MLAQCRCIEGGLKSKLQTSVHTGPDLKSIGPFSLKMWGLHIFSYYIMIIHKPVANLALQLYAGLQLLPDLRYDILNFHRGRFY